MISILGVAMEQARVDAAVQSEALERARLAGDVAGRAHYRNARDRNRLAMLWIACRLARVGQQVAP